MQTTMRAPGATSCLYTEFANEVNFRLLELGMSRAEAAARLGISEQRFAGIITGGEELTIRALAGIADALGTRWELKLTEVAS